MREIFRECYFLYVKVMVLLFWVAFPASFALYFFVNPVFATVIFCISAHFLIYFRRELSEIIPIRQKLIEISPKLAGRYLEFKEQRKLDKHQKTIIRAEERKNWEPALRCFVENQLFCLDRKISTARLMIHVFASLAAGSIMFPVFSVDPWLASFFLAMFLWGARYQYMEERKYRDISAFFSQEKRSDIYPFYASYVAGTNRSS
jgi:hypothetical protein